MVSPWFSHDFSTVLILPLVFPWCPPWYLHRCSVVAERSKEWGRDLGGGRPSKPRCLAITNEGLRRLSEETNIAHVHGGNLRSFFLGTSQKLIFFLIWLGFEAARSWRWRMGDPNRTWIDGWHLRWEWWELYQSTIPSLGWNFSGSRGVFSFSTVIKIRICRICRFFLALISHIWCCASQKTSA